MVKEIGIDEKYVTISRYKHAIEVGNDRLFNLWPEEIIF